MKSMSGGERYVLHSSNWYTTVISDLLKVDIFEKTLDFNYDFFNEN